MRFNKMAPTMGFSSSNNNANGNGQNNNGESLSKTYQYRKIMKPMLERKRRARINKCLDELKELITGALQSTDGEENITKLEKADILELTVRHFHNLKRQNKFYIKAENTYADRFRDGFSQCAKEVTKFLYGQQNRAGDNIVVHLNDCIRRLDSLTNGNSLAINNNNNNNNNNNYIPNENNNMPMDLNQSPLLPFGHQNIRQPIPMPLLRKSPIPVQNFLPLPTTHKQNLSSSQIDAARLLDGGSPLMRPTSRDSNLSYRSSTSPNPNKDDPVWRPW